ncbi:tachykinin-like peptides receptor 86c [Dermatophagoides farinae]|uniref:Tachykinin-like peptides receptor 86c n=1 Tax=Dermatophagoides farinae TaxID=6954 RepID=A0A9D4P9Z7_DERFA|nr:tachykinin-like peptides receptor 86c [Dermatophagoides farinae]
MSIFNEKPIVNASSTIQYLNNVMEQFYLNSQFPVNLDRQSQTDTTAATAINIITTSTPTYSISASTSPTATSSLEVSFLETLLWSLLFYPMVILAAIGNLLIIWIIATKPLMRNIMNQYLMNLTLSDFLSVTFNASFNFVFMLHQHWPFGKIYCIANNFIANLTIVSSVSTMMLISIDR